MSCSLNLPPAQNEPNFTGCDGKAWSNEFLLYHLQKAVDQEDYEWANKCKIEIERRGFDIVFESQL